MGSGIWNILLLRFYGQFYYFSATPKVILQISQKVMPLKMLMPLYTWIMKPYPNTANPRNRGFNYRLSNCRMVMACILGHLKARRRCLWTCLDVNVASMVRIIVAFCALHNICEAKREDFQSKWAQDISVFQCLYRHPDPTYLHTTQFPAEGKFMALFAHTLWFSWNWHRTAPRTPW